MVAASAEEHLAFVLTCLQSALDNGSKIDYDNVAKIHRMSKNTAYFRLWTLRKKAGYTGGVEILNPDGHKAAGTISKPVKKRGRPVGSSKNAKSKKQKMSFEEAEGGDEDDTECGEEEKFIAGALKAADDDAEHGEEKFSAGTTFKVEDDDEE